MNILTQRNDILSGNGAAPSPSPAVPCDRLPRPRDAKSNSLALNFPLGPLPLPDQALEEGPLELALTELAREQSAAAASVRFCYLRAQEARKTALQVQRETEAEILELERKEERAQAKRHSAPIDTETLSGVAEARQRLQRAAAARNRIPWLPDWDHLMRLSPSDMVISLVFGGLVGVSYGLVSRSLYLDALFQNPGLLLTWIVIGGCISLAYHYGVFSLWARMAQLGACRKSFVQRIGFALFALVITGGVTLLDACMVRHGILSQILIDRSADSLLPGKGAALNDLPYWVIAAFASAAYVLYLSFQGFMKVSQYLYESEMLAALEREEEERKQAPKRAALQRQQDAFHRYEVALLVFDKVCHEAFSLIAGGFKPLYLHVKALDALHADLSWRPLSGNAAGKRD